jgi:integrase
MDGDAGILAAYLRGWLVVQQPLLRPTTLRSYRQMVEDYLVPQLGDRRLGDLDRRTIERAYARLVTGGGRGGRPLAPGSVLLVHRVLHKALADAVVDGLLPVNPAAAARPPRHAPDATEVAEPLQVWTPAQARAFLAFSRDHRRHHVWVLALATGLRRGELCGLRWDDVDLDQRALTVRRSLSAVDGTLRLLGTKTSRTRTLGLDPVAVAALQAVRRDQEQARDQAGDGWQDRWNLVFTEPDGAPIPPERLTDDFRRLVVRAPVPRLRLHDLRHCNASWLLASGVPVKVVSTRLGHAKVSMTLDVYAHLLPAMDGQAVGVITDLLGDPES